MWGWTSLQRLGQDLRYGWRALRKNPLFATMAVLSRFSNVSVLAANLTTALGLGLGIDYALFIVARFRECLAAHAGVRDAVVTTVRTAGRTILFSAFTVGAALATLAYFPLYFLRSFAYVGIAVVFIAALSSVLVVPALLALLGHRVNALRLPWSKGVPSSDAPLWGRLAARVSHRPLLAAAPVLLVLLVLAAPLRHARFGTVDDSVLRTSAESRAVNDLVTARYRGFDPNAVQVVTSGRADDAAVAGYARDVSLLPAVNAVQSKAGMFVHGQLVARLPGDDIRGHPDEQWFSVSTSLAPKSDAAVRFVRALRAGPGPDGAAVLVGGGTAELIDTQHALSAKLPMVVLTIALITFVVLFLFTGSVLQPVRAVFVNSLSMAATFGILVWAFQDGHLARALHVKTASISASHQDGGFNVSP